MTEDKELGTTVDKRTCIIWTGAANGNGYPVKWIDGKCRMYTRHLYKEKVGPIPKGFCVCHRCDNPSCINVDHLFLATHSENMIDMILKNRGNRARGERHGRAVLTEEMVRDIRIKNQSGMPIYRIKKNHYSWVGRTTITKVCKRITWRHVTR